MALPASGKVLAIGTLPPPIGGASIFFQRWITEARSKGASVHVVDANTFVGLRGALMAILGRYDEVVVNSIRPLAILLARLVHPRARLSIIDHNASRHLASKKWAARWIQNAAFAFTHQIFLVSPHLAVGYARYEAKLAEICPFVAPDVMELETLIATYSTATQCVLSERSGPLVALAAWRPVEERGQDLYGLMNALDLIEDLQAKFPGATLVMFVGQWSDNDLSRRVRKRAEALARKNLVVVETGQKQFWPVLRHADVMLRLTATDGNSVSIHEALWAGCKVVASDSVPRPDGTTLYRYSDHEDLLGKTITALRDHRRDELDPCPS